MRQIATFLLLLPTMVSAESFLCIAEAGAVVEDGGNQSASAGIINTQNMRFLQIEEDGEWVVQRFGDSYSLFDQCATPYICESSDRYAGAFTRSDDGRFSVTWFAKNNGREQLVVAKGRCEEV